MMEIWKRQPVSHLTLSSHNLVRLTYDVNVAVEYRHQLQILICDEWTLLQMAMGRKLLHETHEKKNLVYLFWQKTLLSTHKIYKKT